MWYLKTSLFEIVLYKIKLRLKIVFSYKIIRSEAFLTKFVNLDRPVLWADTTACTWNKWKGTKRRVDETVLGERYKKMILVHRGKEIRFLHKASLKQYTYTYEYQYISIRCTKIIFYCVLKINKTMYDTYYRWIPVKRRILNSSQENLY